MEKRPDILHHLKEHSVQPPPEVAGRIGRIPHEELPAIFERLQDHAARPPRAIRMAISKRAGSPQSNGLRSILPYAAAACVLVLTAGILLYRRSANISPTTEKHLAGRSASGPAAGQSTGIPTDSSLQLNNPAAEPADSQQAAVAPALSFKIGDHQYALKDNSLLATFASYHFPELKSDPRKRDEPAALRIQLDQYTNITLSKAMTSLLKDLYDTRPDGSLSRKAQKTRERLTKWAEQDKKQFDLHHLSNPLDPIDLAQYLFPPLFFFHRHPNPVILPATNAQAPPPSPSGTLQPHTEASLTVAYALSLVTTRSGTGIGETYNGGIQTLFDAGHAARLRLASLMRIQSIYITGNDGSFTIVQESGKPQKKLVLSPEQWAGYNAKYARAGYDTKDDTTKILGYSCKKTIITLQDGNRIAAWYTPAVKTPAQKLLEPAFAGIPGLVLRYEYTCRHKTIRYTAISLSRRPVDPSVLTLPSGW